MGETDWGGIWVLFWWAGPYSVNLSSNVLLMHGAVFLTAIYLGPNYGGGNGNNGDLLQRIPWYCYTQCPQPGSRPPPTHASTGDSWTLTGKSGSVSCGVTAPFSWVLVHKGLLCPPRVYFPVLCKFWQLHGGLMATSAEGLCHLMSAAPRAPSLRQSTADPYLHRRPSNTENHKPSTFLNLRVSNALSVSMQERLSYPKYFGTFSNI